MKTFYGTTTTSSSTFSDMWWNYKTAAENRGVNMHGKIVNMTTPGEGRRNLSPLELLDYSIEEVCMLARA